MEGILYAEINVFAILIIGMIFWKFIAMKNKPKEHTLFAVLLVGAVVFFAMDGTWALIDAGVFTAGHTASYMVNLLYFMIAGSLPYVWLVYTVRSGANPEFGKMDYCSAGYAFGGICVSAFYQPYWKLDILY